jgi:hypothetical protein
MIVDGYAKIIPSEKDWFCYFYLYDKWRKIHESFKAELFIEMNLWRQAKSASKPSLPRVLLFNHYLLEHRVDVVDHATLCTAISGLYLFRY